MKHWILQDKTVWLGTRRRVAGFKCIIGVSVENWQELCICYNTPVMHLIQIGLYTLSSLHNELLRTQPDSMKKAAEAVGGVARGAVVAVVDNEGRYESHRGLICASYHGCVGQTEPSYQIGGKKHLVNSSVFKIKDGFVICSHLSLEHTSMRLLPSTEPIRQM